MVRTSPREVAMPIERGTSFAPRLVLSFVVFVVAVIAIVWSRTLAARHADEVNVAAKTITDQHDLSRRQLNVDRSIDAHIYNPEKVSLKETFPLTMRIIASADLGVVTGCRPPERLQLKARIVAPNFDAVSSLDEAVPVAEGVQIFSWMLTPHETGLQEARLRGIVYCLSERSEIVMRQTVVDEIRAIDVEAPFVFSVENSIAIANVLLGVIGSGGLIAFIRELFVGRPTRVTDSESTGSLR